MHTYSVSGIAWIDNSTVDVYVIVNNHTWVYWRFQEWDGTGMGAEDFLRSALKAYCGRRKLCLNHTDGI